VAREALAKAAEMAAERGLPPEADPVPPVETR